MFYRAAPPHWRRALEFFLADFPCLVRAQRGCLWASLLLFVLPLVGSFVAMLVSPELVYSLHDPSDVAMYESMYDPANPERKLGRESGDDLAMFGFYIMNNVSIGLRTFASGLLAGSHGVRADHERADDRSVAGICRLGHGDPFGDSSPGIRRLSSPPSCWPARPAAAGLELIAPGRRRRVDP